MTYIPVVQNNKYIILYFFHRLDDLYFSRIYDHGEHKGQLRPPRPDQMVPGQSRVARLKAGNNLFR